MTPVARSVADAAARVGVGVETIRQAIAAGELAAVTVGKPDAKRKTWRVLDADLDAWLQTRRTAPAPHPLVAGLSARSRRALRRTA